LKGGLLSILLDGKTLSQEILNGLKGEISHLTTKPTLAVIIVGNNPASQIYVRNKIKTCERIGITSRHIEFDVCASEETLLKTIEILNGESDVNGILVQLPLPSHIDEKKIIQAIDPKKDVDGFHFSNIGALSIGSPKLVSCTPKGIVTLLNHYSIELAGKHCVIVGRSNIVGKPLAMLMTNNDATVTLCHSKTHCLERFTRQADILISCVGIPHFITETMVKERAVVVDVGINRLENGTLVGDVEFDSVSKKASFITPVPGGVGPMTIATLMENTLQAYKLKTPCTSK